MFHRGALQRGPSAAPATVAYIDRSPTRWGSVTELDASIVEINGQIESARESLAEAYRELKSCEIAQASREREASRKQALRERVKMDELGLEIFRRKPATS